MPLASASFTASYVVVVPKSAAALNLAFTLESPACVASAMVVI